LELRGGAKSGRILFLDVLSAVPPFLLRKDYSQSNLLKTPAPTFSIVDLHVPVIVHQMPYLSMWTFPAGLPPFGSTFPDHFPRQLDGSERQPNMDDGWKFTEFIIAGLQIIILLGRTNVRPRKKNGWTFINFSWKMDKVKPFVSF
jgi:hypothetical protein